MGKVPHLGGYSGTNPSIKSHGLPLAPTLKGVAGRYFGIDLENLANMSDQQLAVYADRALQMKKLREMLPILEQHFQELITGQAEYEQFIARVLKQVQAGAKQVDKAALDMWLLSKGYDQHLQLMNQKAAQGQATLEAQYQSQFNLNNLDFNAALQIIRLRHQNSQQQIAEKVPRTVHGLQAADQLRREKQRRTELLTYGTQGKPGGSFWGKVRQFVIG